MRKPWQIWTLVFGLDFIFVFAMAVLVPADVASQQWAIAYADFMANFVPMLDEITKIPGYVEYTRFFYTVFWCLVPFSMIAGWHIRRLDSSWLSPCETSNAKLFGYLFLILFCVVIAAFWPVSNQASWRDRSITGNWVGIGHYSFIVAGIWAILGGLIRLLHDRSKAPVI